MNKKKGLILLLAVVFIFSIVGCSNQAPDTGKVKQDVVAEYDGGTVTKDEFNTFLQVTTFFNPQLEGTINQPESQRQALEQYIGQKYLASKAKNQKADDKEIEDLLKAIKGTMGSEENYNKKLAELKITENDLVDYVNRYQAIQNYMEEKSAKTFNEEKEKLEKQYKENKEEYTIATVSHILIATKDRSEEEAKKRAEEVLAKLKKGEDFAKLAKEYSDDPGSKDNGGVYENAPVSSWVPEFKKAALTLPVGQLSDLVKTEFGYHIIKVINRQVPTLEQLSDQLKGQVIAQEYNQFMTNELQKIIKKINLPEK
ncbi:MAG: peptidylprolyl isomerase [Tepidibacillus sp.]|uniref:peptidylprolyl isomerase n=1 Tax=Tepidibacillus sp. HK-1 TaxID=1883407 RepID=UPI000853BA2D|nr:peptidylprolyl isomerase [Tepidibacillus sp. HK-1]GBF11398.1 foldase protein PrsA precursor [Tepidibacillus sp. HK-1]